MSKHESGTEHRMYQLIRQPQPIIDRLIEIEFVDPAVEAYAFTFGLTPNRRHTTEAAHTQRLDGLRGIERASRQAVRRASSVAALVDGLRPQHQYASAEDARARGNEIDHLAVDAQHVAWPGPHLGSIRRQRQRCRWRASARR